MVRIYSIPQCKYCNELKEKLTNEGIEFTDVNVLLSENQEEYKVLLEKTKSDEVPIIKVGGNLLLPNISFNTIDRGVELTKSFLV